MIAFQFLYNKKKTIKCVGIAPIALIPCPSIHPWLMQVHFSNIIAHLLTLFERSFYHHCFSLYSLNNTAAYANAFLVTGSFAITRSQE